MTSSSVSPIVALLLEQKLICPKWQKYFWSRVERASSNECWLWVGPKNRDGYSCPYLGRIGKTPHKTFGHRAVWRMLRGEIPDRMTIDHLCLVKHCVNPDHMQIVTNESNVELGAVVQGERSTECRRGHPRTPENTHYMKNQRTCAVCRRESAQAKYQIVRDSRLAYQRDWYAKNGRKKSTST